MLRPIHSPVCVLLVLVLTAPGCVVPLARSSAPVDATAGEPVLVPDLPVSHPPFDDVHASWKHRLDQPYVYLEHVGSYTDTGALIPTLHRELLAQGLEASGPPFCLFYDDPGRVARGGLRSRACIPIGGSRSPSTPLRYDVLPSQAVVYAFVSGSYLEVPRAYPGLYAFLSQMNWVEDGPLREVYIVPPGPDPDFEDLICEIQIPARSRR